MADNTILIALDFADDYQHIVQRALDYAGESAEMHVVTVLRPISHYGGFYGGVPEAVAGYEDHARETAKDRLEELAAQLGLGAAQKHLVFGQPASEIHALAEAVEANCIVMGTHGRHGLGRLLGSTASAVLHGVKCDVLVVKVAAA